MAVRFCREHGLNVDPTDLADEADASYDVVGMFDVLEHVDDPVALVALAHQKLKPGGFLIGYTPHIYSVSWELMGAAQNTLVPFEHIGFFSDRSFRYLAEHTNFEVQSIQTFGFDIMDYLTMKEYEDGIDYTTRLRDMMLLVQGCLDELGISNHFRITFRKPSSR